MTNNTIESNFSNEKLRAVTDDLKNRKWCMPNGEKSQVSVSSIILNVINFSVFSGHTKAIKAIELILELDVHDAVVISLYGPPIYKKVINSAISRVYNWNNIFFLTKNSKYFYVFDPKYSNAMNNLKKGLI